MGNVANIIAHSFPKQGEHLHGRVRVLFHYDGPELAGTVVRDDIEAPWQTIIRLDDDRYILSTECQYSPVLPK